MKNRDIRKLTSLSFPFVRRMLCVLSFLLCVACCGCSVIVPPAGESATKETATTEPSKSLYDPDQTAQMLSQAEQYLADLQKKDMGGEMLVIATVRADSVAPLTANSALDAYREKRNQMISEAFHCQLLVMEYDADTLYNNLLQQKEQNAGTFLNADLLMLPQREIGRFVAAGLLSDIRSLPHVDLSAPYFNQEALDQTAAGNAVYAAAGDFSSAPDYAVGVYYNKTMLAQLGVEDAAQFLSDNSWTWDTFVSLCQKAQQAQHWGYMLDEELNMTLPEVVLASSGYHAIDAARDQTPALRDDTEMLRRIAAAENKVWSGVTRPDMDSDALKNTTAQNEFLSANALFCIGTLSTMETLGEQNNIAWGMLPLPKVCAEQAEYASPLTDSAPLLCVSSVAQDVDLCGMLVQALNAASYGYLDEFYYHYVLGTLAPDHLTVLSAYYAMRGRYYDFREMYSKGYAEIQDGITLPLLGGTELQSADPGGTVSALLGRIFCVSAKRSP